MRPGVKLALAFGGKSDRHTERADDRRVDSELALDFCFTARADSDEKLCCLVVTDSHSKWVQAWPVKAKGGVAARNYMTTEVVKLLSYLGYQSVTVRAVSEPSCTALCESIKALRLKLGMANSH